MRYPASEKREIIRIVEQSHLPVRRTLEKLGILPSTFYRWYDRFAAGGVEALQDKTSKPSRVWNRIPDDVRGRIVEMALDEPELSPRTAANTCAHNNAKNDFCIRQNIGYCAQNGFCDGKTVRIICHIDFDAEPCRQILFERLSIEARRIGIFMYTLNGVICARHTDTNFSGFDICCFFKHRNDFCNLFDDVLIAFFRFCR